MLRWILKPESLARALLIWVVLLAAIFRYLMVNPSLLAQDSGAEWIGFAPFVAAFVAYIFYRRTNPVAAIGDISRDLTGPASTGRGWLVGIVVGLPLVALLLAAIPDTVDQHQWLVWFPVGIGVVFGHAARREPNLWRVGMIGLRRTVTITAGIVGTALIVGLVIGGVVGVQAFLGSYGILGVIAVLLAVIALQLGRIVARL